MEGLRKAIDAYIEKFKEGPPIYGLEEAEALRRIEQALETGKRLDKGAEATIPHDALLLP